MKRRSRQPSKLPSPQPSNPTPKRFMPGPTKALQPVRLTRPKRQRKMSRRLKQTTLIPLVLPLLAKNQSRKRATRAAHLANTEALRNKKQSFVYEEDSHQRAGTRPRD